MKKIKPYENLPWRDLAEYYDLAVKYNLYGKELKDFLNKKQKEEAIPYPRVRRSK